MTTSYPESPVLKDNFSIFYVAMRHQVEYKNFEEFYRRTEQQGWQLHEYLETTSHSEQQLQRDFLPQVIFTPYVHESLFGKTWLDKEEGQTFADEHKAVIKERLNPNGKICRYTENLLLTKKANLTTWLNCLLYLSIEDRTFAFSIEWIDLWLFNDNTSILAFKTKLKQVQKGEHAYPPGIDDLNRFNRLLRKPGVASGDDDITVQNATQMTRLWDDLIYDKWLGFATKNILMLDAKKEEILDCYIFYSKLLTVAQIADYAQMRDGQRTPAFDAYQRTMLAEYPNMREMLLLELATASGEGENWHENRALQYDTRYVKKLFTENSIKIWAYWTGLVLKDVCAFIVSDDNMPLMRNKQAESYFYPLYVHTYHQHFRLDCFSQDIINHRFHDCIEVRQILKNFQAFHNQYWIKDVTIDFQNIEVVERMKVGLMLENKYQVVKEEIKELSHFLDSKVRTGKQTIIAFLILAFYPLQYFGLGEHLKTLVEQDIKWLVGINIGFLSLGILFWYLFPYLQGNFGQLFTKLYRKITR